MAPARLAKYAARLRWGGIEKLSTGLKDPQRPRRTPATPRSSCYLEPNFTNGPGTVRGPRAFSRLLAGYDS